MSKRTSATHEERASKASKIADPPLPNADTYVFPSWGYFGSAKVLEAVQEFRELGAGEQRPIVADAIAKWNKSRELLPALAGLGESDPFLKENPAVAEAFDKLDKSTRSFMAEYANALHGIRFRAPLPKELVDFSAGAVVVPTGNDNHHEYELNVPYESKV